MGSISYNSWPTQQRSQKARYSIHPEGGKPEIIAVITNDYHTVLITSQPTSHFSTPQMQSYSSKVLTLFVPCPLILFLAKTAHSTLPSVLPPFSLFNLHFPFSKYSQQNILSML